mmetsp:Transcript_75499/g.133247  ORF Transcript_75499/g.133247 Transcript_75499/m.133247 type:complete len:278 (-) Transcript_75499:2453-3286(-)
MLASRAPPEPPMGDSTEAPAGETSLDLVERPAPLPLEFGDGSPRSLMLASSATDVKGRSSSVFTGEGLGLPPSALLAVSEALPPGLLPLSLTSSSTALPPPAGETLVERMSSMSESTSAPSEPPRPRPAGRLLGGSETDISLFVCSVKEKLRLPSAAPGRSVCSVKEKFRLASGLAIGCFFGLLDLEPPALPRPLAPALSSSALVCSSATCSNSWSRRPLTSASGDSDPAVRLIPTLLRGPSTPSRSFWTCTEDFSRLDNLSTARATSFLRLWMASS